MSFFKHYGSAKAKELVVTLQEAIVRFDPEGATEAAIGEIEAKFDQLNLAFSNAKRTYQEEEQEARAIVDLYNKRLAAAEHLSTLPEKSLAAEKLMSMLEGMVGDVEREQQEAAEAKEDMDQLEQMVIGYADKLKSARRVVEQAKREMQRAEMQKERAKNMADTAAVAAGLSSSTGGLSTALDHMRKLASDHKASADALSRKAKLLQPVTAEDDPDIKAALDAVSGLTQPQSLSDRLSKLKLHAA